MHAMVDAAPRHAGRLHRWDRHLTGLRHLSDPGPRNSTFAVAAPGAYFAADQAPPW